MFNIETQQINLLVAIVTFFATFFLAVLIFSRNHKSWTNILFTCLAGVLGVYIVVNYLSLYPPVSTAYSQLFWIRMVMFVASFMGPLLLLLVHTFPGDKIKLHIGYIFIIFTLGIVSASASLGSFVFESIDYVNGHPLPVPGPGMPIFFLNFVGLVALSFIILIYKYTRSSEADKDRYFYMLSGIIASFTLLGISSLIFVVILKTSVLVFLGPIFLAILIGSIAYAIVRHQLFDIKLIATDLFISGILIVLFSKIFVAETTSGIIIDSLIFVMTSFFGILLIRTVKKEVEQREELQSLTNKLELANEKLHELDHMKSEFLSFASHQIKAPLAAIKGFATLIYDGTYGQTSDKVNDAAHKIKDASDRMIQLVGDFLNVRKIDEGRMVYKMERVDAVKIIRSIFEELKPLAQNKKLDFGLESLPGGGWINADPQNIRQVFQNLIENSIKYTDSGFVKVKTESIVGKFIFSVSDSGHGISKELLPHLFEEFRRDALATGKIEGTGLGLFIAHQITIDHGGEIWVESEGPGKGSKFLVKLPLA